MAILEHFPHIVLRQDAEDEPAPTCETGNEYDGRMGLRVGALFIIWATSSIGATFPVFAKRQQGMRIPEWCFFFCKYFGSGVIVTTAFIHLLAPAEDALRNPCLTGPITDYPWVEGITLMTVFVLFFVELMVMQYGKFGQRNDYEAGTDPIPAPTPTPYKDNIKENPDRTIETTTASRNRSPSMLAPGQNHTAHVREHTDIEDADSRSMFEDYKAQVTAIFILEFGIIFHSVFIGLTLAVAGSEFDTLFIVIIFHQTFEGLGLGSRLALAPWPRYKQWTPYVLALAYGLSTPMAIGIGLGVRTTYPPESQTTLIVNGVFDSISAGILIYIGLVELMAHEFMFSNTLRRAKISVVLSAFTLMCLGAGLMALLGKWA
ncbi:uncharacterized protein HMPREF1541_09050 [Cyphellophora europaea CBS 101466]|uniref:Uncharacterized protein n=1 Tax=Cyphellophora europaea (strain CBS 101466) TaxID=1220924 RepID=W2RJW2_CYPE1|nr:uncharacterized protein HMPREF1541_09050 [Cyphellophora europaea CBS 101466]ETN36772.1 hypothetical protein HMPREF1541_09050 [Cyphellophora europaea CBS 101466]